MITGYIESELQSALAFAKPGDDIAGILLAMNAAEDSAKTRMVSMAQVKREHHSRESMLKTLIAESCLDISPMGRIDSASSDGVMRALSNHGTRPETYLDAWRMLCTAFGVRSPRSIGYAHAVKAFMTLPGCSSARPCDDAIEARIAELEFNRANEEVPF